MHPWSTSSNRKPIARSVADPRAAAALDTLAARPEESAILLDFDGTFVEIVRRPELVFVPPAARALLSQLAARYRLVAFLSGRPGPQVERLVGVSGVRYVGNHGLELEPRVAALTTPVREFARWAATVWPVEDKGLTLAFHYREAPDQERARAVLTTLARAATARGLATHWGRKVLEVRPLVAANKGTAARALLAERGLARALYAGDDQTDLDAFHALARTPLATRVLIAIASPESPPELAELADVRVAGPAELHLLLATLA